MNDRILLARDGYVFTNGTAYGKVIELGCGDKAENWREITQEEYDIAIAERELEEI